MQKFPHLFSPIEIAGHTYKNRILTAPMLFGFYALEKESAERVYAIVNDRSRGGAAAVAVGETPINYDDAADAMLPFIRTDYTKYNGVQFDAYRKYADIIRNNGAIPLIELFHSGFQRMRPSNGINPWGPVGYTRPDGVVVEAFDEKKMKKVREDFVTCSKFMKAAGFNGILIHGAHGYLFTQFLSPLMNKRTDEYGGSIENRGRFPRQIVSDIKTELGKDFIVEVRVNGADMVPGGTTVEDTTAFCASLDGIADIIHISSGYHTDSYRTHTFSSHYDPHGINVERAAFIKKNIKTPVTVVGGINSPEFAEQIIAEGKVDFVSLGRQCIADPYFAGKALEGREDEIRRCMRCYHCYGEHPGPGKNPRGSAPPPHFGNFTLGNLLNGVQHCSINPKANQEVIVAAMPEPKGSRRVMVVGGGAGGMQAAITAVDRGHQVTLVEKSAGLGGILSFTDTDVHKVDLRNFKDLLVREVNKKNVKVLLNTEATPALITEYKPDALILAVGAEPAKPNITGLDTAMPVLDAYKPESKIGKNVVMLGGGLAGCETAVHLADKGHNVIIVEMLTTLASEIGGMPYDALMDHIEKRKNITVRLEAKCVEVTAEGVKVECGTGAPEIIKGDTVIYSLGMSANRTEVEKLKESAGNATVYEVGDCVRGARVFEAVREGYMAAMKIV